MAGCPERDTDKDGICDGEDQCRDEAQGQTPDPNKKGCPARDKDGDSVFDYEDQCIDEARGTNPRSQQARLPGARQGRRHRL